PTGKLKGVIPAEGGVACLAFGPGGQTLVIGGGRSGLRLWDLKANKEKGQFTGHSEMVVSAAFSPDGRLLAAGGIDGRVRIWDVKTAKGRATLVGQRGGVWSLAFSPDGRLLASGSGTLPPQFPGHSRGARFGEVRLWALDTRRELAIYRGHLDRVRAV